MEVKLTTIKMPVELHKKLKELAAREGTDMTEIIIKEIEEYVKIHGEGNPIYPLDKWADPEFKAIPAFLTKIEDWYDYLSKCNEKEKEEIYNKAYAIKSMMEKRGLYR